MTHGYHLSQKQSTPEITGIALMDGLLLQGFDPEETRFFRKGSAAAAAAGNMKDFVVPYVPSESGCG